MLLDKPDGDAQHMALFEAWTLALRAAFLREATALRFDSPYAVAVHGVAMALVSLRWHWELVTHHCTDGGSKLGGLGGEVIPSFPLAPCFFLFFSDLTARPPPLYSASHWLDSFFDEYLFALLQPTDVDGCDASLGLSYASAALFTTLVVVQFTFHLLWASPRGMKTFFFIPQILSISVLIPGRIVLAASGHSIDAATLLW